MANLGVLVAILLAVWTGRSCAITKPPPTVRQCSPQVAANINWPPSTGKVEVPCGSIFPVLRGGSVSRQCQNGTWRSVDFSGCLLPKGTAPFVLIWFSLGAPLVTVNDSSALILNSLYEVMQLDSLNQLTTVNLTLAELKSTFMKTSLLVAMGFPGISAPNSTLQAEINSSLSRLRTQEELGGFVIVSGEASELSYNGFHITSSCTCLPPGNLFDGYCSGVIPVSPCLPAAGPSGDYQCRNPEFLGDGVYCSPDIDRDGYPASIIQSCSSTSTQRYCTRDNCPLIYNPSQSIMACMAPPDFAGCRSEMGRRVGITWGNTGRGETALQPCPAAKGFARRYCNMAGVWSPGEDVSMCRSYDFSSAFTSAQDIFRLGGSVNQRLSMVTSVIDSVATITEGSTFSLLPSDLESTNEVVEGLIDLLEETLTSDNDTDEATLSTLDMLCTNIFSNVLDRTNLDGWLELTETGEGTPRLLDNIERYSLYVSQRSTTGSTGQLWESNNFALSFKKRPRSSTSSVIFPASAADLQGSLKLDYVPAQVQLPAALFETRSKGGGGGGGGGGGPAQSEVPSSIFLVRNMEFAMPLTMEDGENASSIPSMIVSAQVDERGSKLPDIESDPVKIKFQFDKVENVTDDQYRCAFWKFSDPIGDGYWAFDGVKKTSVSEDSEGRMVVRCTATHLTSFAVLVDVAASTTGGDDDGPSATELQALEIVSYIGCAVSVIFLVITIIFFLAQGRDLLVKMHYFIHLNLAITLCLAYTLFLVGGSTAIAIREACVAVAVVMHYLFLSSFCWMLSEGIMLYLLLVVVFSNISRKPWIFLLIGYALPVVPVVISVGVRHDNYGVTNEDGNLTFCWLSTADGLIWAFVGPMLLVIVINVVFLSLAIYKVFTAKRNRNKNSQLSKKYSSKNLMEPTKQDGHLKEDLELARTLATSVIVLLPVLGLTWVLGVVAVNRNTTVFAWLFTIINSLQGFFIFFFHVIRTDKVWKNPYAVRMRSRFSVRSQSTKESSLQPRTSTTSTTDFRTKSTSGNSMALHSQDGNKPVSDAEAEKEKEALGEGYRQESVSSVGQNSP